MTSRKKTKPRIKRNALDELYGFIEQSNISKRNIARLKILSRSGDGRVQRMAGVILELARTYPRQLGRFPRLPRENPELLRRLLAVLGEVGGRGLELRAGLTGLNPADLLPPAPSEPAPASPRKNGFKRVIVHTDGACRNNPGPGGWAAILRYGKQSKELSGADPATTNNRMELQAALAALQALKEPCAVEIFTDSKYVRDGITRWIAQWKRNGWRTRERDPVKNQDLWQQLDQLRAKHQVEWRWVKGHAGHPDNERCDQLARSQIARLGSLPLRQNVSKKTERSAFVN